MERTLSVNYPVRQNKGVLLNTFKNTTVERYNIVHHSYGKQEGIDRLNVQKGIL